MEIEQPTGRPEAVPDAAFSGEDERAQVLGAYGYETLEDDPELTEIARFAAQLCGTPVAFVSLVERDEQRFIAREGSDIRGTPRSVSFCAHAMLGSDEMVVPDATRDPRFANNELVTGAEHVRFYAGAPLVSPEGVPLGSLCVIDREPRPEGISELQRDGLRVLARAVMRRLDARRKGREAAARESEGARTMREIADLVPAIIWSADADGRFDYYNSRWHEGTGLPRPKDATGWLDVVHPEDTGNARVAWTASFAEGRPFESEFRLKQADGSWRWMMSRALPVHGNDGAVRRWHGTLTDIDDSHRRSETRDILARELSHRIKNIFAVVGGLVAIRARRHEAAQEFAAELNAAIRALGRAHDFVRPVEGAKGDSLRGLLGELMAPYSDGDARVSLTGDDCQIGPHAATPLALIFHELATNSVKYGALSTDDGRVEIAIECCEPDEMARIAWRERGGPVLAGQGTEGFGTRLVKMSIEGQLGGRLDRRFGPEGLEIDLVIPAASIRR